MRQSDPFFEKQIANAAVFVLYDHSHESCPGLYPFDSEAEANAYITDFKNNRNGSTNGWYFDKVDPATLTEFQKQCIENWKP